MHLPGEQMWLFSHHALPFHDAVRLDGFIVNEPPAGAELRGLLAHIFNADVIAEHELPEHRIGTVAQIRRPHRDADTRRDVVVKRDRITAHANGLEQGLTVLR